MAPARGASQSRDRGHNGRSDPIGQDPAAPTADDGQHVPQVRRAAAALAEVPHHRRQRGLGVHDVARGIRSKCPNSGVTVGATHAQVIRNEILGISDGSAGQVFQLQNRPVLRRVDGDADEVVEVHALSNGADGSASEAWEETEGVWSHLPDEDLRDLPHYMIERRTGEVSFGPALRDRTGKVIRYGKIPPRGAQVRIRKYRIGGGDRQRPAGRAERAARGHPVRREGDEPRGCRRRDGPRVGGEGQATGAGAPDA